jgi:hypothetical protein
MRIPTDILIIYWVSIDLRERVIFNSEPLRETCNGSRFDELRKLASDRLRNCARWQNEHHGPKIASLTLANLS